MQYAIECTGLAREFGRRPVVRDIDLRIRTGVVTGFLGPNGAGKTTTIRMLLGLLRPTRGVIRIFGDEMPRDRRRIASRIGSLVETPSHYENLTGAENLEVTRLLLNLSRREVERALETVDLGGASGKVVGDYSLGMRQRLGIARALLGAPQLLILDEPTNGLDPVGIIAMRRLIRSLADKQGLSVFVSSHLLGEVEQTIDDVVLLHGGRLLAQGPLRSIVSAGGSRVIVGVQQATAATNLLRQHGMSATPVADDELVVTAHPGTAEIINSLLVSEGFPVRSLGVEQPTLEAVYLRLTRSGAALAEAA